MEVKCLNCGSKIADYSGPIGINDPMQSMYFVRIDGTQPTPNGTVKHPCPGCGETINELMALLAAVLEEYKASNANLNPTEEGED
jgi:hypothetical protein